MEFDGRQILGGLNHNQMRDIFQGFRVERTNEIGEEKGVKMRGAEEGYI